MLMKNQKILLYFFLFNFFIIFAFNFPIFLEIMDEWWSPGPYNHGLLGLGLALYVFWTKRKAFKSVNYSLFGLFCLCLSSILFLIANLASIGQLQSLSLFFIAVALLISIYGFSIIKKISLPLLIILLTLPIWNILQVPLRELSTWVSFYSVEMLGFDIARSGYHLITPGGVFIVEEACSGLGFFLTSAVYAVFVSQINNLSRKSSLIYLLFSIFTAIFANWVRIIVIVIVGSQTAMQHFIVQDHLTFGWLVFMAFFIPVIVIGHLYFSEQVPEKINTKPSTAEKKISLWGPISTSVIILVFTISTLIISSRFDNKYKLIVPSIPLYTQIGSNNMTSPNWFPVSNGVSNEEFSYFSQGDTLFQIYLANYIKQNQGNEMIFVKNSLFDNNRWFNAEQQSLPYILHLHLKKLIC